MLVSIMNTIGAFPTQYWSKGTLEGWEGISAESLLESARSAPLPAPIVSWPVEKFPRSRREDIEASASWDLNMKPSMRSVGSAW